MKVNNICCIGAGYVGGPTMSVIALKCPNIKVTVVDINQDRIDAWNGPLDKLPIYERGLAEVVGQARGRNLFFSTEIDLAIEASEIIFMAVNTPTKSEGEGAGMAADLRYIEACAKNIAKVAKTNKIVVEKSTLPVRTAEKIKDILNQNGRDDVNFEILSNPEFLAEGTAIQDLFKSDRVLIGGDPTPTGQEAVQAVVDIYAQWIQKDKILTTNVWSSELAKLASNAILAQRISSINSLSALCEKTGADIDELSKAIGMDNRIGSKFLKASVGFGGSCFKKDILNLVYLCRYYGLKDVAEYWHQVVKINEYQRNRFAQKIIDHFKGDLTGKKIAILGWAFKADTNDSRESAAIYVSDFLIDAGAEIAVYDPMVKPQNILNDLNFLWKSKKLSEVQILQRREKIKCYDNYEDAIYNSQVIGILTEWNEFKSYPWEIITKNILVIDGRNILNNDKVYSIGK